MIQAKTALLKNIPFRKSGFDTFNSTRMIYILAVYPFIILLYTFICFLLSPSGLFTLLLPALLVIYWLLCLRMMDRIKKELKVVRFYFLEPEVQDLMLEKKEKLGLIIKEILG